MVGLVSVRAYPRAGGSCTLYLWGSNLLRDPSRLSLGPQGTQFPRCATGRRSESLDKQIAKPSGRGLLTRPFFSLSGARWWLQLEARGAEANLHNTNYSTANYVGPVQGAPHLLNCMQQCIGATEGTSHELATFTQNIVGPYTTHGLKYNAGHKSWRTVQHYSYPMIDTA